MSGGRALRLLAAAAPAARPGAGRCACAPNPSNPKLPNHLHPPPPGATGVGPRRRGGGRDPRARGRQPDAQVARAAPAWPELGSTRWALRTGYALGWTVTRAQPVAALCGGRRPPPLLIGQWTKRRGPPLFLPAPLLRARAAPRCLGRGCGRQRSRGRPQARVGRRCPGPAMSLTATQTHTAKRGRAEPAPVLSTGCAKVTKPRPMRGPSARQRRAWQGAPPARARAARCAALRGQGWREGLGGCGVHRQTVRD